MHRLLLLAAIGCAPAPGTCELPYEGGVLCYELGPGHPEGYPERDCMRHPEDGNRWTADATCADLGYDLVCTENDGYLVYGDGDQVCCAFGYPPPGSACG